MRQPVVLANSALSMDSGSCSSTVASIEKPDIIYLVSRTIQLYEEKSKGSGVRNRLHAYEFLALQYLTGKEPKHEGHYEHQGCKECN